MGGEGGVREAAAVAASCARGAPAPVSQKSLVVSHSCHTFPRAERRADVSSAESRPEHSLLQVQGQSAPLAGVVLSGAVTTFSLGAERCIPQHKGLETRTAVVIFWI